MGDDAGESIRILVEEGPLFDAAGITHPLTRGDLDEMIEGAGYRPALRDNGYNIL